MKATLAAVAIAMATTAGAADWVFEYLPASGGNHVCLAAKNVTPDFEYAEVIVRLTEPRWRVNEKPQLAIATLRGDTFFAFRGDDSCPTDVAKRSFPCSHTYTARYRIEDDAEWSSADFGIGRYNMGSPNLYLLLPPKAQETAIRRKRKLAGAGDDAPAVRPSTLYVEYESRTRFNSTVTAVAQIDLSGLQDAWGWVRNCAEDKFTVAL